MTGEQHQQPAPRTSDGEPMNSQLGKIRNPAATFFLSLITCGIYGLVWLYKIFDESKRYVNNRNGVRVTSPGLIIGLMFIPIFNIIWGLIVAFKAPGLVSKLRRADGAPAHLVGSSGALGLLALIPLIGTVLLLVGRLLWQSTGLAPTLLVYELLWGIWALALMAILPPVGGLLWIVLTQRAINRFWRETEVKNTLQNGTPPFAANDVAVTAVGTERATVSSAGSPPQISPSVADNAYKKCPHCAEFIRFEATKCRYCHEPV